MTLYRQTTYEDSQGRRVIALDPHDATEDGCYPTMRYVAELLVQVQGPNGTGHAMERIELAGPTLGDAFNDLDRAQQVALERVRDRLTQAQVPKLILPGSTPLTNGGRMRLQK